MEVIVYTWSTFSLLSVHIAAWTDYELWTISLMCVREKQISRPDIGFLTVHPKYGYMGLTVDMSMCLRWMLFVSHHIAEHIVVFLIWPGFSSSVYILQNQTYWQRSRVQWERWSFICSFVKSCKVKKLSDVLILIPDKSTTRSHLCKPPEVSFYSSVVICMLLILFVGPKGQTGGI